MPNKESMKITFWGARGSRPVPGPSTIKYGGNTACVEIQAGERLIILDAGSGICNLGRTLSGKRAPVTADIFFSHLHWDHVQGLPFFTPLYQQSNSFTLYGEAKEGLSFSAAIRQQISPPGFPVSLEELGAAMTFREIGPDQTISLSGGITIRTLRVNHPGHCLAYRIDYKEGAVCYLTDVEHSGAPEEKMLEFVRGAQIVIYDAQYTQEEYLGQGGVLSKKGWGHSTWQEGIRLVRAAGAPKLVLFHHCPERTDEELDRLEREAVLKHTDIMAAKEGMILWL